MNKILGIVLILLILSSSLFGQDKRKVGLIPFVDQKKDVRYKWVSFGFEYYLRNKLSVLSGFYVPEKEIIRKVLEGVGFGNQPLTEKMIYHIGRDADVDVVVTGKYRVDGNTLTLNVVYSNGANGSTIFDTQIKKPMSKFFDVGNEIVNQLINLAGIPVSDMEKRLLSFTLTKSVDAFESFIKGYLENEKENGRIEVITGLFRQAIRKDPNFWEAYYNLGIAYYNWGKLNEASAQFDKVINALPNFAKSYYGRGLIYYYQGEYEKALNDFRKVTELNPNDYDGYFYMGRTYLTMKKFKEAEEAFNNAIKINPQYAPVYYELGNIFYEQGYYKKAIGYYRSAVELDEHNADYHVRLGDCYYRSQIFYNALNELDRAIQLKPNNYIAYFLKGLTIYKQAVLEELIEAFLELLDNNGKNSSAPKKVKRGDAGISFDPIKKKQVYLDMAEAFSQAVKYNSQFKEALFNLALTYHEMGKLDLAEQYYHEVIKIDNTLLRVHLKLAELYTQTDRLDQAIEEYRRVFYLEPTYILRNPTLGPEFRYMNILDKFKAELEEQLAKNPNDVRNNITLARLFEAQGNYGKAANLLRRVLNSNPNNQEAKKLLAELNKY